MKKAVIILIGDELLLGQVQDTHLFYMAKKLLLKGIMVKETRIIGDKIDLVIKTIQSLIDYDFIFITGGLGPTHDDITKIGVSKALNLPLILQTEAQKIIKRYWNIKENHNYALLPESARLIVDGKTHFFSFYVQHIYVFPGVPHIMKVLFDNIFEKFSNYGEYYCFEEVFDIDEEYISKKLSKIQEDNLDVQIGSYPIYFPHKHLKISVKGFNKEKAQQVLEEIKNSIVFK